MQINVTGFQSSMYITYLSFLTLFCTFGKVGLEVSLQHEPCMPIKQLIFITNKVCMYMPLLLYHAYNYIKNSVVAYNVRTYIHMYEVIGLQVRLRAKISGKSQVHLYCITCKLCSYCLHACMLDMLDLKCE